MTAVREKLLPAVSKLRGIADTKLGLRRFALYVRRETPSDGAGGIGATWTVVDTAIAEKPRVRQATQQDVVQSAGRVQMNDYLLDSITPRNDGDTVGTTPATLDPTPSASGQQVFFVLVGPGLPAYVPASGGDPPSGGGLFTPVKFDPTGNFGFSMVLRPATGRVSP